MRRMRRLNINESVDKSRLKFMTFMKRDCEENSQFSEGNGKKILSQVIKIRLLLHEFFLFL